MQISFFNIKSYLHKIQYLDSCLLKLFIIHYFSYDSSPCLCCRYPTVLGYSITTRFWDMLQYYFITTVETNNLEMQLVQTLMYIKLMLLNTFNSSSRRHKRSIRTGDIMKGFTVTKRANLHPWQWKLLNPPFYVSDYWRVFNFLATKIHFVIVSYLNKLPVVVI